MATTLASAAVTSLHCRHCGGEIPSDSRRVQCAHCGALFPFACLVCSRNLRTPFPVFDDERYLTFASTDAATGATIEAKPLCAEHFLRHCPDCGRWFHAHENPGFFRCARCAEAKEKADMALLTPLDKTPLPIAAGLSEGASPRIGARQLNANMVALAAAGGALLGLLCWYLLQL